MDEGNVGLLERPQHEGKLIDNPEQLIGLRNELRLKNYSKEINYSDAEREANGDMMPKDNKALLEMLDGRVKEAAGREDREEDKKDIPDFVLSKEDNWESIGWPEDKKKEVRKRLREVLGTDKDSVIEHALQCIVATGNTPEVALQLLTKENIDNQLIAIRDSVRQRPGAGDHFEVPERDRSLLGKSLLLETLGISSDYIRKFIFHEEFTNRSFSYVPGYEETLQREFDGQLPADLYELAWNIGFERKQLFGIDGKYPVLQMAIKTDDNGKIDVDKSRFVVNEANWMRWMRDHINWWYEEYDTDDVTDYFSKVEVKKGPFYSVNLVTMLYGYNRYFRDETGHLWQRLYDQTLLEPWMTLFQRDYALSYDKASQDEEQLANTLKDKYHYGKLMRNIYGKSMVQLLSTLPVDYEGPDSDTKLGEAFQRMFLAYYNLADIEELKKVLGKDSPFFNKSGWDKAIKEVMGSIARQTHMPQMESLLGDRQEKFLGSFDTDGSIKKGKEQDFIDSINIFNDEPISAKLHQVVKQVLMDSVQEQLVTKEFNKLGVDPDKLSDQEKNILKNEGKLLDDISLRFAWLLAHSWSYFSGGRARSNGPPGVAGYLAETKWLHTDAYRMKYMTFGGAGNPYTVPMFKQLSIPLFEGVLAENSNEYYVYKRDKDGNPTKDGIKSRQLTAMEVFKQMHQQSMEDEMKRRALRSRYEQATTDEERAKIRLEQEQFEDVAKNAYKILASQLEFRENAMRVYAKNVVGRAKSLYEQLMKSKETAFDKFITYDGIFRGPSFNREAWQEALQEKYFTPLRYLFEANRATQLNHITRAPVYVGKDAKGKGKWIWKDQYLGERMLGHQIVDIPAFWQEAKDYSPVEWEARKKMGFRKRGKYVIRPDGKHEIDWNKAQENKSLVYKQWMLMKLAGDLWSHIDRHSTDPYYTLEHFDSIVDAIKWLPGDVAGTEYDMNGVRVNKPLFDKHQIEWLEKISGKNRLFFRTFLSDIFVGDKRKKESMFGESSGIILNAVFRGYG